MIELLKVEEKKKKGVIGAAAKAPEASATAAPAATKRPSAQDLLAVKLRRKEPEPRPQRPEIKDIGGGDAARCSTTDEELEALFSAIDQEIIDDPDAVLDLLDVLEDHPEATPEMQEEMEVIKSCIYLPPEDDYEMELDEPEKGESTEDEEMKEMLTMIENAKGEIDTTNEEELVKMMDRLDDDEYFEKLRNDVLAAEEVKAREVAEKSRQEVMEAEEAKEKAKKEAEAKAKIETETKAKTKVENVEEPKMEEDASSNKRRAEETLPEKEPSEKKPKTKTKTKKALAAGGVNMFGGKDLFGGKNPFAGRKQEISSDEEEEVEELETDTPSSHSHSHNGTSAPPPPPPPPNIAIQPDADEKPVSFDDLPSDSHVIPLDSLSLTKGRVSNLPSRRRPTGRGAHRQEAISNGNGHAEGEHLASSTYFTGYLLFILS